MKQTMTRYPKSAAMTLCLLLGIGLFVGCEQFGAIPSGAYLDEVEASPHYDHDRDMFVNRRPDILDTMTVGQSFWQDPFGRDKPNFLFNSNQTVPDVTLTEVKHKSLAYFLDSQEDTKFIWLGHSTILLSIADKVVLFDPIFSDHAAPIPIAAKRFQPPAIDIHDLPEIDYIIISHDHYDHLDMETVKHFAETDAHFLTPLGVGSHLRYWGVPADRMTELDWWDEATMGPLTFAATPSQHFSGRIGVMHNNKTLWASWVIQSQKERIFFSGDSGYDTHYQAIGERYGPFDIVFMENGQYNEDWRAVHNMPEEAITGFQELGGDYLVPIHWGMFDLSVHNWYDPPREITKRAKAADIKLITPRLGAIIPLSDPPLYDSWWEALITTD